jgi:2-oxo-4-hydroxy-4-carboxy--5-ureidoimidazoline (OHCU) decarboxylase
MKKASEYRLHARECRDLAGKMDDESQRRQLLEMAAHWDKLAVDRVELIRNHPELALHGEHEEEAEPSRPATASAHPGLHS